MSNKLINNLLKKMENNPNRYKPSNKPVNTHDNNKDDGQEYLMDLGKLLCVVFEHDEIGEEDLLRQIYISTWDKIYKKILDVTNCEGGLSSPNMMTRVKCITALSKIDEYTKTNGTDFLDSDDEYYPKLFFREIINNYTIFVVPLSEIKKLNTPAVGGRRRKTYKNKRK